jgi:ankyrin repeat protein
MAFEEELKFAVDRGDIPAVNAVLDKSTEEAFPSLKNLALGLASEKGNFPLVKSILDRGLRFINSTTNGYQPLVCAASKGHLDIVNLLLDRGADVNMCTDTGTRALMAAAECGNLDLVSLLLNRGADVNEEDFKKETALDKCVEELNKRYEQFEVMLKCIEIVRLLSAKGAKSKKEITVSLKSLIGEKKDEETVKQQILDRLISYIPGIIDEVLK